MVEYVRLNGLVNISKGKKPEILNSRPNIGCDPYLTASQLTGEEVKFWATGGVKAKQNDVLISWDGTIGNVGWSLSGIVGSTIGIISPKNESIHPPFLGRFLRSQKQILIDNATGATIKHIRRSTLENLMFPKIPLDEQKKVSTILDLAEKTKQSFEELEKKIESVWKSMFQEKVISEIGRYPISRKKHPIMDGWEWVKLIDVAKLESGHTPSRKKPEWWNGDVSWITLGDIRAHDGRTIFSTKENTNYLGIENSSARILPEKTVCFARTASVGFVAVMGKPMSTSQDFVNFVCSDKITPEYLLFALLASRKWLLSIANGSTHKTIYYPVVKSLFIALPRMETQHMFSDLFYSLEELRANFSPANELYSLLQYSSLTELI